jgi:hypothetical protein
MSSCNRDCHLIAPKDDWAIHCALCIWDRRDNFILDQEARLKSVPDAAWSASTYTSPPSKICGHYITPPTVSICIEVDIQAHVELTIEIRIT